jgi:hypothetical protein
MRPGRELDTQIAQKVFNYPVFIKKRIPYEGAPLGERPLRNYSKDIAAAWEVAEKMGISILPIADGSWFAMVGKEPRDQKVGWKSPAEFIEYLQSGSFAEAGAAVNESAPLAICLAALSAITKKEILAQGNTMPIGPDDGRVLQ